MKTKYLKHAEKTIEIQEVVYFKKVTIVDDNLKYGLKLLGEDEIKVTYTNLGFLCLVQSENTNIEILNNIGRLDDIIKTKKVA